MNSLKQFRELPNPIRAFGHLFQAALRSLLPDLAACPWYIREHEVVNLFVFQHLIPQFQNEGYDIAQLGIEVPIQKIRKHNRAKFGRNADIAVWPHVKATRWQRCKPLAVIEWKNISCREKHPAGLIRDHESDIVFLQDNAELISVGYAVLTDQRNKHIAVQCKRILKGTPTRDLFSTPLLCSGTCSDSAVQEMNRPYADLGSMAQNCPACMDVMKDQAECVDV